MSFPKKIHFETVDSTFTFRVQCHREDDTKLVVKSRHPEAVDHLVLLVEADLGITNRFQGSNYFICEVDKEAFAAAIGKAVLHLRDADPEPQPIEEDGTPDTSDGFYDADDEEDYSVN